MPKSRKRNKRRKLSVSRDKKGRFRHARVKRTVSKIRRRKSRRLPIRRVPLESKRKRYIDSKAFYRAFRKIARARPSKRYFDSRYQAFVDTKTEKERFQTAAIFIMVKARINPKDSTPSTDLVTQVWVRRIRVTRKQSIKWWSKNLKQGNAPPGERDEAHGFLYNDLIQHTESENATLLQVVGFEGVR